jgi:hypothetical protein
MSSLHTLITKFAWITMGIASTLYGLYKGHWQQQYANTIQDSAVVLLLEDDKFLDKNMKYKRREAFRSTAKVYCFDLCCACLTCPVVLHRLSLVHRFVDDLFCSRLSRLSEFYLPRQRLFWWWHIPRNIGLIILHPGFSWNASVIV